MSKERPTNPLLTTAVAADFPSYSEITVNFPDQWELVREIRAADTPIYIAALPRQTEIVRADHFPELGADINRALTTYRHYKTFLPWLQAHLSVGFDERTGTGHVRSSEGLTIQLIPIGQAQVWHGGGYAVLWECYLFERHQRPTWGHRIFSGKIYAKPKAVFYCILMPSMPCPWCLSSHTFSPVCVASSENRCRRISSI